MSLTDRLKKIQMPTQLPLELSIHELENSKMDFGSTHRGKLFSTMWSDHQDWIKWFVDHYQNSTNVKHRKMLHYIELKIERHELEGTTVPIPSVEGTGKKINPSVSPTPKKMSAAKTMAKSLAIPAATKEEIQEELEESWEEVDVAELSIVQLEQQETRADVQALQSRMLNIENVLQTIVSHLQSSASTPSQKDGY